MLADTDEWKVPVCFDCWEKLGSPAEEPEVCSVSMPGPLRSTLVGMGQIRILQNIEGKCPELANKRTLEAEVKTIGALPRGMSSGRTSVSLVGKAKDGRPVLMQVSLRQFQMAAAFFGGVYGDETGQVDATVVGGEAVVVSRPDEGDGGLKN